MIHRFAASAPTDRMGIDGAEQPVENVAEIPLENVHSRLDDGNALRPIVDDGQALDVETARRWITPPRYCRRSGFVAVIVEIVGKGLRDWPAWPPLSDAGMLPGHRIFRGSQVVSGL